ncbi:MAG: tetratricopeptide repeat protein [bacterium]
MIYILLPIVLLFVFLVIGIIWFTPEFRVKILLRQGKDRKARKILEYLLEQNPERINLYRKLGQIYYLENRRDKKALRVFEIIIKLKIPFQWREEILPLVAKYYVDEGRKDSEAIKLIEKAVEKEIKQLKRYS